MPEFTVRSATPADEAQITALLEASYPPLLAAAYDPAILKRALPMITRANPKLLASGTCYVAELTVGEIIGDVVGVGGWTHAHPGTGEVTPGQAHIRHFATHPDHLGNGIGRKIYEQCQTAAHDEGVTQFECYSSLNAEPFYTALGFTRVRPIDIPMGPTLRFPSIIMRRALRLATVEAPHSDDS